MRMLSSTTAIAAALIAIGLSAPAQALSTRAWVSGHGTDTAGCGGSMDPCRTLQYAHDSVIAAGGEIDILDPASYGPVSITKSLSIVNDGVGTAGVPQASGGNAITINAPGASIYLRGLTLDGLGVANNGILMNGADSLTVVNCVVRHFSYGGINIAPGSGASAVSISNAIASDNWYGVLFGGAGNGTVTGVISQTTFDNNSNSGFFIGLNASATIVDSIASNNSVGFYVYAGGGGTMRIGRSIATGNDIGVNIVSGPASSYGDNEINGNSTDVSGTLTSIKTR